MFDLVEYLWKQLEWSEKTFGSGVRTEGICKHIESELDEIRKAPHDLEEWIDVIILAMDGAWRAGYTPEDIAEMLKWKQEKNFNRKWPDPTNLPDDEPSFHEE